MAAGPRCPYGHERMTDVERNGQAWLALPLSAMVAATLLLLALRLPLGASPQGISAWAAGHFLLFGAAFLSAFPLGQFLSARFGGSTPHHAKSIVCTLIIAAIWLWFMLAVGPRLPLAGTAVSLILLLAGGTVLLSANRGCGRAGLLAMVAAGAATAVFHQLILITRGYAQPWAFEKTLAGVQHQDTVFHAAIAGMYMSHGVPSIGIDGDLPINYHAASHFLIGHLAAWAGLPPLQAYSLFVPIVGGPLLLAMLLGASEAVLALRSGTQIVWSRQLAVLVVVFLAIRVDRGTLLISESYFVSITCMLAGIWLLIATQYAKGRWSLLACALVAMLLFLTSMSKISTGAVMACGVTVWMAFKSGRPTVRSMLTGAVVGLAPFLVVYATKWMGVTARIGDISPFAILFKNTARTVFDLAFGAIVAAWVGWRCRGNTALYPPILGLTTMVLAASGSALLLTLPHGSDFYFLNVGVASAFCLLPLVMPFQAQVDRLRTGWQASVLVLAVLIAQFSGADILKIQKRLSGPVARLSNDAGGGVTESVMKQSPYGQILTEVEKNPGIEGVYVDPSNNTFWRGYHRTCWVAPLTVPALTGVPMLMGYPPLESGCNVTPFYGFHAYKRVKSAPLANASRDDLCNAAKQRGMSRILRIAATGMQEIVNCGGQAVNN